MRLVDFISRNAEPILAHWEAFAGSLLPAATNMGSPGLRDHAQQILQAVERICGLRRPGKPSARNHWGSKLRS
jgi:hypothetical protein